MIVRVAGRSGVRTGPRFSERVAGRGGARMSPNNVLTAA
ncbi:hypothetical protein UKMH10_3728 [Burkholderia pseudomallei]|nr:hypothetical protein UKMH10_3728 [Burkholderia pseudomallei]